MKIERLPNDWGPFPMYKASFHQYFVYGVTPYQAISNLLGIIDALTSSK